MIGSGADATPSPHRCEHDRDGGESLDGVIADDGALGPRPVLGDGA
jgi:hypothetical protein